MSCSLIGWEHGSIVVWGGLSIFLYTAGAPASATSMNDLAAEPKQQIYINKDSKLMFAV